MNVSHFLFNAKAGILDLSRERPISNKGTIDDIRRREEEQLRPAGFPKFSQLGSQNAISAEPNDVLDINVKVDPNAPVVPVAPVTPPPSTPTPPTPSTPTEPEPEKKELPKPSIAPPFLLPGQKDLMDQWNEYLKSRYGEQQALPYVDKVTEDSEEFTALSAVYQYLLGELRKAQRQQNKTKEWLRNTGLVLAHFAVEGVSELIKSKANGVGKFFTDKIKDQLNRTIGGQYTDIEGAIKNAINAIFVGYERWKGKLVQTVEDKEGEPDARNKIFEAGMKVREEYKKYKKGELDIGSWKNSDTMGGFEDAYDAYVEKYGKKPRGIDEDPLRWNNGEEDPPLK
jgi:hypothetical protein